MWICISSRNYLIVISLLQYFFIFLKTFNAKCFYSEVSFTDQISKPLQTFLNLYISKDIGKNVSKTEEVNTLKIFLIMLSKVDLLRMRLKLLQKKQFIKLQKHLVNWLVIKLKKIMVHVKRITSIVKLNLGIQCKNQVPFNFLFNFKFLFPLVMHT